MAKKRRFARWKVAVTAVVILSGGTFAVLKVAEMRASADVERERVALRKLGYPTTLQEYRDSLPNNPSEDAYAIYLEANIVLKALGSPNAPTHDKPDEQQRYVQLTDPVYQILLRASKKDTHRFESQSEALFRNELHREYDRLKEFAKICMVRADVSGRAGDWRTSLDALSVGVRISAHARQPSLIGHLVSLNMADSVTRSFNRLLEDYRERPEFLRAARTWLDQIPEPARLSSAFDLEIAGFHDSIEHLAQPGSFDHNEYMSTFQQFKAEYPFRMPLFRRVLEARYLRSLREVLELPSDGPWQDVALWEAHDAKAEADTSAMGKLYLRVSYSYANVARIVATEHTRRRLLDVALWLCEQHDPLGTLPEKLPDDERFLDPWTGERYVYIKRGEGFTIRSVGPNKVDDGGERSATGSRTDDRDVSVPP